MISKRSWTNSWVSSAVHEVAELAVVKFSMVLYWLVAVGAVKTPLNRSHMWASGPAVELTDDACRISFTAARPLDGEGPAWSGQQPCRAEALLRHFGAFLLISKLR